MTPRKIGDYEIIEKLGSGSMGEVYKAQKENSKETVAIKCMSEVLAQDKNHVARFQREISHTIMLDHPNIVATHDVGEYNGRPYCVMEYARGVTLKDLIFSMGALEEKKAVPIIVQIAEALKYANAFNGLIHRDVKPDNIIITYGQKAKLLDMGIAKTTESTTKVTQTGVVIGSPGYMSPEQVRGDEDLDVRTDIFSLGATFYHLVTGYPPFEGDGLMEILTATIYNEPIAVEKRNPEISIGTREIIMRMLVKDRAQRYQNFSELLTDLASIQQASRDNSKERDLFRECFVPTMTDTLLAQMSLHNKLLSLNQVENCLDYQENLALSGIILNFDDVLLKRKLISPENHATLTRVANQFIVNRGDDLFVRIAKEYKEFNSWQAWEKFKKQGETGIAAKLLENGILKEPAVEKIFSRIHLVLEKEEIKAMLKLAFDMELTSRLETKKCGKLYNERVALGVYTNIDEIFAEQGLTKKTILALRRAVRRSVTTGRSAKVYLKQIMHEE